MRASTAIFAAALAALALPPASAQDAAPAGDFTRIQWQRPFKEALRLAKERKRLVFAKPIVGGTHTPKKDGPLAAGKEDCEGAW